MVKSVCATFKSTSDPRSVTFIATQVMKNLEAILTEAGLTFNNIIKTTVLLADMNHFSPVNTIYGTSTCSMHTAPHTIPWMHTILLHLVDP